MFFGGAARDAQRFANRRAELFWQLREALEQGTLALPEDEIFAAVQEASERAVVEQRQVLGAMAFRFTHAFFRQTLYEEIFAPRRIRLHQRVGRALEEIYGRTGGGSAVPVVAQHAAPGGVAGVFFLAAMTSQGRWG